MRLVLLLITSLFLGCSGPEKEEVAAETCPDPRDTGRYDPGDTTIHYPDAIDLYPELGLAETWLKDRYGPETGTIVYDVVSEGMSYKEIVYFTDHGERQAVHVDEGFDRPTHRSVETMDSVFGQSIDDEEASGRPWWSELDIQRPNYNRMTRAICDYFNIKPLATRTYLGRKAKGYASEKSDWSQGPVKAWVWKGIVLYEEEGWGGERGMTYRLAVSFDESRPNLDVFNLD